MNDGRFYTHPHLACCEIVLLSSCSVFTHPYNGERVQRFQTNAGRISNHPCLANSGTLYLEEKCASNNFDANQ